MFSSLLRSTFVVLGLLGSAQSWATMSGGNYSLGINIGIVNSSQTQMNELIKTANAGANGPVSTGQLNQAYEAAPFIGYRFSGTIFAMQFRPSYFYQKEDGTGTDGGYSYSVTGFTAFPILRLYPLENDFMKFYMQFGLGYGQMKGEINEGAGNSVKFGGGAFGTTFGLGAEFCFSPNHCLQLEGDYRYLSFERNVVDSSSGSGGGLSQFGKGQEIEVNGSDLSVRMGGLMFLMGYTMYL